MRAVRFIVSAGPSVLAVSAVGALSSWASALVMGPGVWRSALVGAAVVASMALVLLFEGRARSRATRRLRAALGSTEASAGGLPGSSGMPAWFESFVEDVERRLERDEQQAQGLTGRLREAEIRLSISEAERRHGQSILHSLRDAVLVTDAYNELALANASAGRLLGFDPVEAAHRPIDQVVGDEELRRIIKEVRQSGVLSKQRHLEHAMTPLGGASALFDVTISCLPSVSGGGPGKDREVGGVVTILRDITREKEISQMKSDFVSQASHELRTPIASINAYVEMLLDAEAQDEKTRQEFYSIIKSEAERLSRMIDNMLNISRIEAGIVSVERTEVDFVKVIREVIETMQPQARAKSIMLIEKVGPLIYTAEADRDMMHQVIMNLVSNATKYTPEGGRVTVSVENDDATRSILVSVQDTGLGIPPEAKDKIFGKFFRIESYKRMAKGTGLGLNLVKHIVETVHHGQVGVHSQVGMGSRFWFTVPYEYQSASLPMPGVQSGGIAA